MGIAARGAGTSALRPSTRWATKRVASRGSLANGTVNAWPAGGGFRQLLLRSHVYKAALFLNALRFESAVAPSGHPARVLRSLEIQTRERGALPKGLRGTVGSRPFASIRTVAVHQEDLRLPARQDERHQAADGGYDANVVVRRAGELFCPIDIAFDLDNGERETFRIDGKLRTIERTFDLPAKPKRAAVNPRTRSSTLPSPTTFFPAGATSRSTGPATTTIRMGLSDPASAGRVVQRRRRLKAGYVIQGSYLGVPRGPARVYYGFESDRVDFSASYEHRLRLFGNNSVFSFPVTRWRAGGDFDAALAVHRRVTLLSPPRTS